MSKTKVYEIEATILLRQCFEVDAVSKNHAYQVAEEELKQVMVHISRDSYDSYDIDIENVQESEGH